MKINTKTQSNYIFKKKGITLLELMLSITIFSILLTMGFSAFDSSIKTQNSISASEQIISAITKAKYYSRSKGVVTSINLPAGSNSYSISADGEIISNNNYFDALSGKLPENIEIIQNSCGIVNFYVDGSPVDSSNDTIVSDCSIKVGYADGPQKIITIKGNSGNVIYQ